MSFYVTLPSNVDNSNYKNTQSNYTTLFPVPLSFNVQYEVALVEFTFREYMSMDIGHILVQFPQDTEFRPFKIKAFDNEPIQHLINRLNSDMNDYFAAVEFLALDRKEINVFKENNIDKINIDSNNPKYQNIYNKLKSNIKFVKPTENEVQIDLKNGTLVKFEGYAAKIFESKPIESQTEQKFQIHSDLFNLIDYLMVYTDIIEPQFVGNTRSELLQTVTKNGIFNRTTEKIYTNPHYLPLNRSFINSININIRYPNGEYTQFESLTSKVLVKLHFRPVRIA